MTASALPCVNSVASDTDVCLYPLWSQPQPHARSVCSHKPPFPPNYSASSFSTSLLDTVSLRCRNWCHHWFPTIQSQPLPQPHSRLHAILFQSTHNQTSSSYPELNTFNTEFSTSFLPQRQISHTFLSSWPL